MSSSRITSLLRCTQSTPALRRRISISFSRRYTPIQYRCISHSYPLLQSTKTNTTSSITSTSTTTNNNTINSQPSLPIRIALVSSATALATPSFPALGFLYLVLRVTIPDDNLRKVMEGRWGTVLSFTTWTLLPKLYHGGVTSIILPFAISNAIVAGSLYGILDLATGGPNNNNNKILQTPWICGSGIGGAVGYIAPNYLYGPIMENMYGLDGMSKSINTLMSYSMTTEISVVTGMVAGLLLHPMLYYPIHGVKGQKWQYFSGTALES